MGAFLFGVYSVIEFEITYINLCINYNHFYPFERSYLLVPSMLFESIKKSFNKGIFTIGSIPFVQTI